MKIVPEFHVISVQMCGTQAVCKGYTFTIESNAFGEETAVEEPSSGQHQLFLFKLYTQSVKYQQSNKINIENF